MPSGICGNLAWETILPKAKKGEVSIAHFSVKANEDGIRFQDGSGYDVNTDTTLIMSANISFKIKRRRSGLVRFMRGEWETIIHVENGQPRKFCGNLKIIIKGGRNASVD